VSSAVYLGVHDGEQANYSVNDGSKDHTPKNKKRNVTDIRAKPHFILSTHL